MSTRALVVVDFGNHFEYRYNHSDGYPSYLGSFLRKHMKDLPTIQSIFNEHKDWSWIEYGNDKSDGITAGYYEDDAGVNKEIFNTIDEVGKYLRRVHGDCEFVYYWYDNKWHTFTYDDFVAKFGED